MRRNLKIIFGSVLISSLFCVGSFAEARIWYSLPVYEMEMNKTVTEVVENSNVDVIDNNVESVERQIMYAPDGRTEVIDKCDVEAWKSVGWYEMPVQTMYAPDGRTAVVDKSDVQAWKNVGWYESLQMANEVLNWKHGFNIYNGNLYYINSGGGLLKNARVGAYQADENGKLTQVSAENVIGVPYISQIDGIYAWVGCEPVAALAGLKAKGFAVDVRLKDFLDNVPRTTSNPEKGFVGDPYTPDKSKKTRTTIYPKALADYCNKYCNGMSPCEDIRGYSVEQLKRELLLGNCVVAYMTLRWEPIRYRNYNIEGEIQRLVSNNHAVVVCGYSPEKGYFISDPYNEFTPGRPYQYWKDAETFEIIWNERKVGMIIR